MDTIGPWTLEVSGQKVTFSALTIIDTVTNLTEIVRLENRTSAQAALRFTNTWLASYPKPVSCIYDQGTEFIGHDFQFMLDRNNIIRGPTTTKNPQANVICKQMHQSVGNSLRILYNWHPPAVVNDAATLVDTALANAMYATRALFNSSLNTTPGAMAFHCDMVMNIPFIADLQLIQEHRQQLIDQRLIEQNRKHIFFDYQPGQQILKFVYEPNKLAPRAMGPYTINTVHANGTVTIQLMPHTIEHISLRRVKPFKQ